MSNSRPLILRERLVEEREHQILCIPADQLSASKAIEIVACELQFAVGTNHLRIFFTVKLCHRPSSAASHPLQQRRGGNATATSGNPSAVAATDEHRPASRRV